MIYDIIVIGSGPGGYIAAIRAAQLGFKTAIVEREHLGGICLNWGCIPTKALLKSADIKHSIDCAGDYGFNFEKKDVSIDLKKIVKRSRSVSSRLNSGVSYLMKKNKIDVIWGEASLTSVSKNDRIVEISVKKMKKEAHVPQPPIPKDILREGNYRTKHLIIATGARPKVLPHIKPDGILIWTYFEAMVPKSMPKSLLIMGSGAIGMEFASFYNDLGVEVTVVERLPLILSAEDVEISTFARKQFEAQGIKILTESEITDVSKGNNSISVTVKSGKTIQNLTADRLISAIGVQGNIENLGLEVVNVKTSGDRICVDSFGKTNVEGIYAIGDVTGPPMLAHKAEHEGVLCVEHIAALPVEPLKKESIPGCTYCRPQIASVGLTEARAKEAGYEIRVGRFPFSANGKAIALNEDRGFVKTIFEKKTGRLLGAHLIGPEVTELIQGFVIAMSLETTEEELIHTIFPHPTLSESMKESVLDAYGRVLNS